MRRGFGLRANLSEERAGFLFGLLELVRDLLAFLNKRSARSPLKRRRRRKRISSEEKM
jgi:hypothetical protein